MHYVISENALFKRVARALYRTAAWSLHRCREDSRGYTDLGRYYWPAEPAG